MMKSRESNRNNSKLIFVAIITVIIITIVLGCKYYEDSSEYDSEDAIIDTFMSFDNSFFAVASDFAVSVNDAKVLINRVKYKDTFWKVESCNENEVIFSLRYNDNGNWMYSIIKLDYEGYEQQVGAALTSKQYEETYSCNTPKRYKYSGEKDIHNYPGDYKKVTVTRLRDGATKTIDLDTLNTCNEGQYIRTLNDKEFHYDCIIESYDKLYVVGCVDINKPMFNSDSIIVLFEYNFDLNELHYCSFIHYTESGARNYFL